MTLRSRGDTSTELRPPARVAERWRRILAPAVGRPFSTRCVEIACRLAKSSGATLYLVYILEVPRTFGLDSSLPEQEAEAKHALEAAAATAARFKITLITRTHRVRSAREGIIAFIGEQEIDLLVLGARPDEADGLPRELSRELFLTATCEVVVDYIAGEQQAPMEEDEEE